MPNEPEREIEKALKACAQQRREAAGLSRTLHPATRKLLQGEVARTYSAERGGANPGSQKFRFAWPIRVAVVGALLLLGLVAALFLPGPGNAKLKSVSPLAKNESSDRRELSATPEKPDASVNKFKDAEAATAGNSLNRARIVTGTTQANASTSEDYQARSLSEQSRELEQVQRSTNLAATLADKPISAHDLPVPGISYDSTTPGGSIAVDSSNTPSHSATLQFARVNQPGAAQKNARSLADPRVLNSFRVEQTGDQLRVVDGDGSIYAGYVEKAEADAKTSAAIAADGKLGLPAGSATNTPPAQATQSYFFRVSGTNLTLRQELVFSGHFVGDAIIAAASPSPPANSASGGELTVAPAPDQPAALNESGRLGGEQPAPAPLQLFNCRVTGRAIIGGTNQMEINAQATPNRQR